MFNVKKEEIKDQPLVSVIVPIYKVQAYLSMCIDSILNQTYENLEIILVDDGSPDACPHICNQYADKDRRIKVIHKTNGGLVSGRKAGLAISEGKYVLNVDSDDWIEKDFVQTLVEVAENTGSEIVAAGFTKDLGQFSQIMNNAIAAKTYKKTEILKEILPRLIFSESDNGPGLFSYVWNKLFLRDYILPYQMSVPNGIFLGEDAACSFPAIARASCITVIENYGYHYQQRADSMLKTSGAVNNQGIEAKKADINGLRRLYDYLYQAMMPAPKKSKIFHQIDEYALYLLISRTGGLVRNASTVESFVFGEEIKGKTVTIIGAGTFGQHTYANINVYKYCTVKQWVDDDFQIYQSQGFQVVGFDEVKYDADYFLICMLNDATARRAQERLASLGITKEQIIAPEIVKISVDVLKTMGIKILQA